jgi:microsomal dipeptidase-like Zn-dependent dipeptidase
MGLEDVTKMPAITEELVRREYSEDYIRLILGGNHLRLIKQVVG